MLFGLLLVCSLSTPIADCEDHSAERLAMGPMATTPFKCLAEGQQLAALWSIVPEPGQYLKIACLRDRLESR
jgi:hypothetical protein